MNTDYAVIGDLGGDRYIVRMFAGLIVYDKVVTAPLDQLHQTVEALIASLLASPTPALAVISHKPDPFPGDAVVVPGKNPPEVSARFQ